MRYWKRHHKRRKTLWGSCFSASFVCKHRKLTQLKHSCWHTVSTSAELVPKSRSSWYRKFTIPSIGIFPLGKFFKLPIQDARLGREPTVQVGLPTSPWPTVQVRFPPPIGPCPHALFWEWLPRPPLFSSSRQGKRRTAGIYPKV